MKFSTLVIVLMLLRSKRCATLFTMRHKRKRNSDDSSDTDTNNSLVRSHSGLLLLEYHRTLAQYSLNPFTIPQAIQYLTSDILGNILQHVPHAAVTSKEFFCAWKSCAKRVIVTMPVTPADIASLKKFVSLESLTIRYSNAPTTEASVITELAPILAYLTEIHIIRHPSIRFPTFPSSHQRYNDPTVIINAIRSHAPLATRLKKLTLKGSFNTVILPADFVNLEEVNTHRLDAASALTSNLKKITTDYFIIPNEEWYAPDTVLEHSNVEELEINIITNRNNIFIVSNTTTFPTLPKLKKFVSKGAMYPSTVSLLRNCASTIETCKLRMFYGVSDVLPAAMPNCKVLDLQGLAKPLQLKPVLANCSVPNLEHLIISGDSLADFVWRYHDGDTWNSHMMSSKQSVGRRIGWIRQQFVENADNKLRRLTLTGVRKDNTGMMKMIRDVVSAKVWHGLELELITRS
jgi:hypothetical protein